MWIFLFAILPSGIWTPLEIHPLEWVVLIFYWFDVVWSFWIASRRKPHGFRLGERDGQATNSPLPIHQSSKLLFRYFRTALQCVGASSYIYHTLSYIAKGVSQLMRTFIIVKVLINCFIEIPNIVFQLTVVATWMVQLNVGSIMAGHMGPNRCWRYRTVEALGFNAAPWIQLICMSLWWRFYNI